MDRGEAEAIVESEPVIWARVPRTAQELILRLLTGRDANGVSAPLRVISARFDGEFDYRAGVSGTPTIPESSRVVSIAASAPSNAAASVTINGGQTIVIEAGRSWANDPEGRLQGPEIVFTGTSAYFVELVTMSEEMA